MPDSKHITLAANTVATVTLDNIYFSQVEVVNVTGTASVYFTVNGAVPTIEGEDTIVLPAAIGGVDVTAEAGSKTIRLISSGTPKVSVRAW